MTSGGFATFSDRNAMLRFIRRLRSQPTLSGVSVRISEARPIVVLGGMSGEQSAFIQRLALEDGQWFPDTQMGPFPAGSTG